MAISHSATIFHPGRPVASAGPVRAVLRVLARLTGSSGRPATDGRLSGPAFADLVPDLRTEVARRAGT